MPSLPFEIQEKILAMVIEDNIEKKLKKLGFTHIYRQKVLEMEEPWKYLIKSKDLDTIIWMVKSGYLWDDDAEMCGDIIHYGNIRMLEWFRDSGYELDLDAETFAICGVYSGNLEMLEWLLKNGCEYDEEQVFAYAVQEGNTKILDWCLEKGFKNDEDCYHHAMSAKNTFEVLEWLYTNRPPLLKLEETFENAIFMCRRHNKVDEVVEWFENKGFQYSARVLNAIIRAEGSVELVSRIIENGCPWDKFTMARAVSRDNIEVIKWLIENDCPRDSYYVYAAVGAKHTNVIGWLVLNDPVFRKYVGYCDLSECNIINNLMW